MDKIDYLILSELLKNGQISFSDISKKLSIAPFTVKSRYSKMVKDGILQKAIINIDLAKLGYQGKVFLLITNAPNKSKLETMEALKSIGNIFVVSEIIGPYDLIAIAPVTDVNSVRTLIDNVRKLPSVQRVQFTCINDTMFPINKTYGEVLSKRAKKLATE